MDRTTKKSNKRTRKEEKRSSTTNKRKKNTREIETFDERNYPKKEQQGRGSTCLKRRLHDTNNTDVDKGEKRQSEEKRAERMRGARERV